MRTRAKTCNGVSYAPRSPEPQAGFPETPLSSCLLASSARSMSLGIDDHEVPVATGSACVLSCIASPARYRSPSTRSEGTIAAAAEGGSHGLRVRSSYTQFRINEDLIITD